MVGHEHLGETCKESCLSWCLTKPICTPQSAGGDITEFLSVSRNIDLIRQSVHAHKVAILQENKKHRFY